MTETSFPHDPGLRGLANALDPAQMRQVIQRHVFDHAGLTARACRIERMRYRRGERAVIQYALSAEDRSGAAHTPIVSALLFAEAGRAASTVRKLSAGATGATGAAGAVGAAADAAALPPGAHVADLDLALQMFPHDRKLPGLARLLGDPERALGEIAADIADVAPSHASTLALSRYRAGLSATLRIGPAGQRLFAKIYPDDGAVRAQRWLTQVSEDPAQRAVCGRIGVNFNTSAGCAANFRMLALREVTGTNLDVELGGTSGVEALRHVAPYIARFNQSALRMPATVTHAEEAAGILRARDHLSWVLPDEAARLNQLAGAAIAAIDCSAPAPAHRDLKADHVFLNAGKLTLIDMDMSAAGDPLLDPALFIARLYALRQQQEPSTNAVEVEALPAAFEDAYLAHAPHGWRQRLRPLVGGAILSAAMGFFGRQTPGWRDSARALLDLADRHTRTGRA